MFSLLQLGDSASLEVRKGVLSTGDVIASSAECECTSLSDELDTVSQTS